MNSQTRQALKRALKVYYETKRQVEEGLITSEEFRKIVSGSEAFSPSTSERVEVLVLDLLSAIAIMVGNRQNGLAGSCIEFVRFALEELEQ